MKYTSLCYVEKDNKYLMLYRNKKKSDYNEGKWIGLGGKLEKGESMEDCVKREVFEESGLKLKSVKPRGAIFFINDICEHELMCLYTADYDGKVASFNCDEGELSWISKDKVMDLALWEGDKLFLPRLIDSDEFMFMILNYHGDELISCCETYDGKFVSFTEAVYAVTSMIPKGKVATYGLVSKLIGKPGASRAVGNILHVNDDIVRVPCHRVVNSKGGLAAHFGAGSPYIQKERLEKEGVFAEGLTVDLSKYLWKIDIS